eukprot:gene10526-11631_t
MVAERFKESVPWWTSKKTPSSSTTKSRKERSLKSEKRMSSSKLVVIESIGQDMIYNIMNRAHRTSKHVKLALCTKRKTGSKVMVKWMNRLGHGISYDEVDFLETFLAEKATKHQEVKSFCPSSLLPSTFVTFVWDNNDVNPETLSGQQSFTTKANDLPTYISKKRENPSHLTTSVIPVQNEPNELSCLINFLWVVVRQKSETISMWTGFNYLIETNEDIQTHQITYLPAINESPTKLDVVLEALIQSKLKAEELGLSETDVVFDQAIFAKAVEVVLNPVYIELKKSIVLRMGAFHTALTLLAVIGKRFGDAGLRDWIVEAGLLGEGSVDKVIKGKHYNRAVHVLKYLYVPLVGMQIDKMKEFMEESGHPLRHLHQLLTIWNAPKGFQILFTLFFHARKYGMEILLHSNRLEGSTPSRQTSALNKLSTESRNAVQASLDIQLTTGQFKAGY